MGSSDPVGRRPTEVWNVMSACDVAAPKIPSAPPRTVRPVAMSARWSSTTRGPRSPRVNGPAATWLPPLPPLVLDDVLPELVLPARPVAE